MYYSPRIKESWMSGLNQQFAKLPKGAIPSESSNLSLSATHIHSTSTQQPNPTCKIAKKYGLNLRFIHNNTPKYFPENSQNIQST